MENHTQNPVYDQWAYFLECVVAGLSYETKFHTGRDRLVVRTLRCGRSNPGSNPGHGIFFYPKLVNGGNNQRQSSVGSHTLESLSVNTTRDQHFYPVLRERTTKDKN